eukprot:CAMPEP_0204578344 /NCGR_PEP_ID=MMETSP0661-20131031/42872_1 /ASSEMBLY_ACC=CAM_ASM_000606 /TAXON_ID=109239 /ORGANISM="Alexandrium margalefi, Strain AMGDE01CS-322" /LENGTH=125 /DNA_ID=CAMNT_0051587269 /DNA_START=167 /DNA_END=540 /DNA_ORIENTATION=+
MAGRLLRPLARYAPPLAASACFAYAGHATWQAWRGSEEAQLHERWAQDARELDQRRVEWAAHVAESTQPPRALYAAEVLSEVHNRDAVGPAGLLPRRGEKVQVLEEGSGLEGGFSVVRGADGAVG